MHLWLQAIGQLAPGGRRPQKLGNFLCKGHKIWTWTFDVQNSVLIKHIEQGGKVYRPIPGQGRSGRHLRYAATHEEILVEASDLSLCSVTEGTMEEVRITSTAKVPLKQDLPTSFLEVLAGWNCSWMWRKMKITGGTAWMYEAIADKSLIGVTDGSFI